MKGCTSGNKKQLHAFECEPSSGLFYEVVEADADDEKFAIVSMDCDPEKAVLFNKMIDEVTPMIDSFVKAHSKMDTKYCFLYDMRPFTSIFDFNLEKTIKFVKMHDRNSDHYNKSLLCTAIVFAPFAKPMINFSKMILSKFYTPKRPVLLTCDMEEGITFIKGGWKSCEKVVFSKSVTNS